MKLPLQTEMPHITLSLKTCCSWLAVLWHLNAIISCHTPIMVYMKGCWTFETCFLWCMYNSCGTNRTPAVLTLCQTLCRFMTNCIGLHCYHPFTLHRTRSNTNRKWQRSSPGACASWPVDLNKLDWLISSPLFAWSWLNFLCDPDGQFGFV